MTQLLFHRSLFSNILVQILKFVCYSILVYCKEERSIKYIVFSYLCIEERVKKEYSKEKCSLYSEFARIFSNL